MIALLSTRSLINHVLFLHGVSAYVTVALLCAGEAAVMLGFICPGETAVVLGGVLASQHKVSLWVMGLVVISAAIVGDSIGFEVGRRFGPWILSRSILRRREGSVKRAQRFIERRGGFGVVLGRWTALLRALVPGLAGMSGMPYPRFLVANAVGAVLWGPTFLMLGFVLGTGIEHIASLATYAALGVVLFIYLAIRVRQRTNTRRLSEVEEQQAV